MLWCALTLFHTGEMKAVAMDAVSAEIQAAVADLSADEFSRRQSAEQLLLQHGPAAFPPLIASLGKDSSDASQRVLVLLERIWLQTPVPQADALERQLETLRLTSGPQQPAIERLLFAHHRLREARALFALRRCNAVIVYEDDLNEIEQQNLAGEAPLQNVPKRITQIILPRRWKGTDADLWHIQRLAHLRWLMVFVVRNNGISESARLGMQVGFPGLQVSERAEVFLGVVQDLTPFGESEGCYVSKLKPGSPAELAGVQPGDRILSVDGIPIRNFTDLVNSLMTKRGYEPIELEVDRGYPVRSRFENGRKAKPLILTAIGIPWEAELIKTPPPPPPTESLIPVPPFPEIPPLPGAPVGNPVGR